MRRLVLADVCDAIGRCEAAPCTPPRVDSLPQHSQASLKRLVRANEASFLSRNPPQMPHCKLAPNKGNEKKKKKSKAKSFCWAWRRDDADPKRAVSAE